MLQSNHAAQTARAERTRLTELHGPLGGPCYVYRGVAIDGDAQGALFRITWPNTDVDGGKASTDLDRVCQFIDNWLAQHRPPNVG
jgi:hypothetical protein